MKQLIKRIGKIGGCVALVGLIAALIGSTPGCAILGGGGTTGTNVLSGQQLTNAAILVQSTVRSAMILVIDKNGSNAVAWTAAARDTLSLFLGGTNFTPGALQSDLQKIPVKELKSVEVQLAISTILGVYQIYYADYISGQLGGNTVAVVLLTAVRDGLADAISMSSITPTMRAKMLIVAPVPIRRGS